MSEEASSTPLAALNALLQDESVYEIFVDRFDRVYVERPRGLEDVPSPFRDADHLTEVARHLAQQVGVPGDGSRPLIDARLSDGTRINIVLPPVSEGGPSLTIRKFFPERVEPEDLIAFGTWSEGIVEFLNACVAAHLNILLAGGTGSGKTMTLNVMAAAMIPEDERIIVIEEREDIRLPQKYVVTLEAQPANLEGKGAITLSDLVRNAMRMRPDRLVVGEVRGPEVLDLVQAMNTGYEGTLFTIHASGPGDALDRMETMANMSTRSLPPAALREMISAAVDVIVHQERLPDGRQRILAVTEVQGMQGDVILTRDLFRFEPTVGAGDDIQGHYTATGHLPNFLNRIQDEGIELSDNLFTPRARLNNSRAR